MSTAECIPDCASSLVDELRRRRIFYHNIEIADGIRTRFDEDYDEVPYLRRTDASELALLDRMDCATGGSPAGQSVLDVGCADGLFSVWAARRGASRVLGVERNVYNYEHACFVRHAANLDNVSFVNGPVESVDASEPFDDVFALGLLYHVIDPVGTLHKLRRVCRDRLFATIAIDLDADDDAPMARLDRYMTDGHGFWSFNVAYVRQIFETAGFEIETEEVTDRHEPSGRPNGLFITARPGSASDHHIFAPVIDQEFPPSIERRREAIRRVWPVLGERFSGPVALFGAGRHTPWLLEQTADLAGPRVVCVLDDRPPSAGTIGEIPVRKPHPDDAGKFDAVLVSSWFQHETIEKRCRELYGDRLPIISLTSSMVADLSV